MSSPSRKIICERLLVAWFDNTLEVLEMELVVSPRGRELKAGDKVTARRQGKEEPATVINCYNREILELKENVPEEEKHTEIQEEEPGPSVKNTGADDADKWVALGNGTTRIRKIQYLRINWQSYTMATRRLLGAVFSRETLATHSMPRRKSLAFPNKLAKNYLDPIKVSDIVLEVMERSKVPENYVRKIITTKCADECKMWRTRENNNNENNTIK